MIKIFCMSIIVFVFFSYISFGDKDSWDEDKTGWSNLMFAVYKGNEVKVKNLLLSGGENINYSTNKGYTALVIAVMLQNYKMVETLINNGADVKNIFYNQTLLMVAARYESTDIIKILIKKGLDINASNESGYTPLKAAASRGSVDVLKLLIENGADINYQEGGTALILAASNGNPEKVKLLLQAGASKNIESFGWTAHDFNERAMEDAVSDAEIKNRKIIRKLLIERVERDVHK